MLDPGEAQGILNAVNDLLAPVEERVVTAERIATDAMTRVGLLEQRANLNAPAHVEADVIAEIQGAVAEIYQWAQGVDGVLKMLADRVNATMSAVVRVLGGEDGDAWREFVVREAVRLGVSVKDLHAARVPADSNDG